MTDLTGTPHTYSWYCYDHNRTKQFGTAQRSMEQDATRHRQRYPGHKMDLRETRIIYRMGWRDADQLSLIDAEKPLDGIPF
jgi:hypothetical protein